LKNELKRAIFSKTFLLSIIIFVAVLVPVMWDDLIYILTSNDPILDYLSMFSYTMGVGPSFYIIALICAMPFSFSFADEWNTGYYKTAIIRSNIKKYISKKILSVSISGGLACMIGVSIIFIICLVSFGSFEPDNQEVIRVISRSSLLPLMSSNINIAGIQYIISKILFAGLYGMVWSLFGLAISAWIPNRYLALISPFVVSFVLLYISYSTNLFWINPAFFVNPSRNSESLFVIPLYYLVCFAINYLLFYFGIKRRYKNA
jgi:hypothetical protein